MRKLGILSCLIFAAIGAEAASFSASGVGTTAADFLSLGAGARAMAMGGAYSAAADDATALYWNPAAMAQVAKRSATLMYTGYIASSFYDYGSYVQNMGRNGAFGVGIQYFSAGSIPETDVNFNSIGAASPYDLAVTAGYAYRFGADPDLPGDGFSLGVAGKYIESRLVDTARTEAVDLGMLSPGYFDNRLRLALTAQNLGGTLKYDQEAESLPLAFRAAAAVQVTKNWLTALDVVAPKNDSPCVNFGTEYLLFSKDAWRFAGRAGFSSQTLSPSAGIGIGLKGFSVDYAFVLYSDLGDVHRISLTFNF